MAARAFGLHCPPVKNFVVRFLEMLVQTVGHAASLRAKRLLTTEASGKDIAEAVDTNRAALVKRIVIVESIPESKSL